MANNSTAITNSCAESNVTFPVYPKEQLGLSVFKITAQVVIGVSGTAGNVAVCVTLIRRPNVLKAMRLFLLSLAFADTGILLLNLPIGIFKQQDPFKWILGEAVCRFISPATETFYGASIWSITAIALVRYTAITSKTLQISHEQSTRKTFLILASVWLTSFAFSSLPLYVFQRYDKCYSACFPAWPAWFSQMYNISMTFFFYCFPLGIIAFSYLQISREVSESSKVRVVDKPLPTHGASSRLTRTKQIEKIHRVLTPLVILFSVTMLPLTVLRLVVLYWSDFAVRSFYPVSISVVVTFTIINSSANPIVYCVNSKEFRREMKSAILPSRCHPRRSRVDLRSQINNKLALKTLQVENSPLNKTMQLTSAEHSTHC